MQVQIDESKIESNKVETTTTGDNHKSELTEEALNLFHRGIPVFLSDPETKQGIHPFSEFEPITDKEILIKKCVDYPKANLEVAIDRDYGFVALQVRIGEWGAEESIRELVRQHGSPSTLTYHNPNGDIYYLFKPDADALEAELKNKLGLRFLDSCYGIPVLIDGKQIRKLGTVTTVQNLSDWLAGEGKIIQGAQGESEEIDAEKIESEVSEVQIGGDELSEADPERQILVSGKEQLEEQISAEDPVTVLRSEISAWIAGGSDKNAVLTKSLDWSQRQETPVNIEDIVSLINEIVFPDKKEEKPPTGEELLFRIAEEMFLFRDEKGEPCFFTEGESYRAPSKTVAERLKYQYLKQTKSMPKKKDLLNVLAILESRARFEGIQIKLRNRVAGKNAALFYDMRDKKYLKVTADKWEIIQADFPMFRHFQHMQTQMMPVAGGDPWEIFDFLNVDTENQLLIIVYLISLFVPRIAHPVFAVFGDQGSAKSFFCTVINRLVDPTLTERIIQPKNERDLIQTLRQKYVTVLDNLSKIDSRVSDIFCQVCTGGSISLRQLYTDEGENIAQFRHVVILNSISLAIVNADLMDRSIILRLHRIDPEERKPEEELWDLFESARPRILGGIFDTLVKALAIYPTLNIDRLPRLADFAKWGYAIAEALGQNGNQFLEDFNRNVKRQNESVVEKNVLCQTVLRLMSDQETYLNSVADAHNALKNLAGADHKDSSFPKLPQNLRGGLDILRSPLAEHGITYQFLERQTPGVQILFRKTASQASSSPPDPLFASCLATSNAADVSDVSDVTVDDIPAFDFGEEVANA